MPFVRKTDSQGSQPPTDSRKLFIGRSGELLFFVQNILKPEEPAHYIISIWGQGGVEKSTSLARFIDEAHSAECKDYCLTALVDEQQTTPLGIMEKFANQLHMKGKFENALKHYKEAMRKLQTEGETIEDAVWNRFPEFAGAAAEMVPVVGPFLREGAKATAGLYLDKRKKVQGHRDAELLDDPINALTRAFVDELNQLAESQVLLVSQRVKKRRVFLFFDTFEQLAAESNNMSHKRCGYGKDIS